MRFGPVAIAEAEGAVLAHSIQLDGRKLAKGTVLGADHVARLLLAGIERVTVARLDPGDVGEDRAAEALSLALVPDPKSAGLSLSRPHAGRVNLNATRPGIVEMETAAIQSLNRTDPAITLATLAPLTRVTPGMLVGTVKIISYAVPGPALEAACAAARAAIRVRPVTIGSVGLILTEVAGHDGKLARKAEAAVAARLDVLGIDLVEVRAVAHEEEAIAAALSDIAGGMTLILTEAATSDLYDTAPQALRRAGGEVSRFGMPVDPGNLLFHGRLGERPVIGLPGCARSPALNGADWVLERLACGLDLTPDDIAAMGVGGLLKEIPLRPQPREARR
ncbi:molybdopterin-binding protein [Defluviimonas sp. WL0002]|uniref:Molybdopterin-binding protein n=1 Tax=Albidovulum marisflavi TaxID=2984159 RepID=A0ABT2ZEN4_9RHOB|nr:molybdopterin-binding protein [Defluviimonas sp. WL0002]MCV2869577.1 molybdopterin-binding protein [Defluviimonas sp. WL0002]